jgi:hypothetical protein
VRDDATPNPSEGEWADWSRRLGEAVRGLADGQSLTITAPSSAQRPVRLRKARLRGFLPAKHQMVAPWVRLTRSEDHLRGFCIGSDPDGGGFPLSPEERTALTDLGWHEPPPLEGPDCICWWPDDVPTGPYLPEDEARRAVTTVTETFRTVLAVPSQGDPSSSQGDPSSSQGEPSSSEGDPSSSKGDPSLDLPTVISD